MIFVDTGAFLARYLASDQHHGAATDQWTKLKREHPRLFTSSFVLDETLTLLGRRAGYAFAAHRGRAIYASEILTVLRPDVQDELDALSTFQALADQKVSFTDCISFELMRRNGLDTAFTFDRHFETAGFHRIP
jgi:predicted nucleic acid-binding protein